MSCSWNIYWNTIFNNTKQETCKVRCRLISTSTTTALGNIGSIRVSLQSNTSRVTNGLNIGNVLVKKEGIRANYNYLECNTLETEGVTMIIPKTDNSVLNISIYDVNEKLIDNCPYYQVWLYFDTDD